MAMKYHIIQGPQAGLVFDVTPEELLEKKQQARDQYIDAVKKKGKYTEAIEWYANEWWPETSE